MTTRIDLAELDKSWAERWPTCRPIGHELRNTAVDNWIRFHSLPNSKRYAENPAERREILLRHNTLLDELVAGAPDADGSLLAVTCAWSPHRRPTPRDTILSAASPEAIYWQSLLQDPDDEVWTHLHVEGIEWNNGCLDDLLLLAADWNTRDVIIAPRDFRWLYHPYDGGMDVIAVTSKERHALRDSHQNWLSQHPREL